MSSPYAAVDPEREYGFVAVAAGEGLKNVFADRALTLSSAEARR